MGMGIVTSLFNYTMKSPVSADTFVGLKNYITLFQDPVFLKALVNTFILVIVAVPAVTLFSLWVGSSIYAVSYTHLFAARPGEGKPARRPNECSEVLPWNYSA